MFAYLKTHHNSRIVFDPTTPNIDYTAFKDNDWEKFNGDIKECIPENAPKPRGGPVTLRMYVDADHAGDKITRRSRTGYLLYMQKAPMDWYTKK
jgi:hypothetical protein